MLDVKLFWAIILSVLSLSTCTEIEIDEFEIIDGIRVEKRNKQPTEAPKDTEHDDGSNDEDEDYYEKDELDDEDGPEDDLELTKHLPTKCHVCRLLVADIEDRLARFGSVRKERNNKPPIYWKEERVILLAMENVCQQMLKYNIRRTLPFRYKKGVKSYYRRQIEETTKDSKVKQFMWLTSEQNIDDPTGEIRRLKEQCHELLVDEQHMLIHWFLKAQSRDLTKWLCAKRVLVGENQDCLKLELPTKAKQRKRNKRNDDNVNATSTIHEEL